MRVLLRNLSTAFATRGTTNVGILHLFSSPYMHLFLRITQQVQLAKSKRLLWLIKLTLLYILFFLIPEFLLLVLLSFLQHNVTTQRNTCFVKSPDQKILAGAKRFLRTSTKLKIAPSRPDRSAKNKIIS